MLIISEVILFRRFVVNYILCRVDQPNGNSKVLQTLYQDCRGNGISWFVTALCAKSTKNPMIFI